MGLVRQTCHDDTIPDGPGETDYCPDGTIPGGPGETDYCPEMAPYKMGRVRQTVVLMVPLSGLFPMGLVKESCVTLECICRLYRHHITWLKGLDLASQRLPDRARILNHGSYMGAYLYKPGRREEADRFNMAKD